MVVARLNCCRMWIESQSNRICNHKTETESNQRRRRRWIVDEGEKFSAAVKISAQWCITAARKVMTSFGVLFSVALPVAARPVFRTFTEESCQFTEHGTPALVGPVLAPATQPRLLRHALHAAPALLQLPPRRLLSLPGGPLLRDRHRSATAALAGTATGGRVRPGLATATRRFWVHLIARWRFLVFGCSVQFDTRLSHSLHAVKAKQSKDV